MSYLVAPQNYFHGAHVSSSNLVANMTRGLVVVAATVGVAGGLGLWAYSKADDWLFHLALSAIPARFGDPMPIQIRYVPYLCLAAAYRVPDAQRLDETAPAHDETRGSYWKPSGTAPLKYRKWSTTPLPEEMGSALNTYLDGSRCRGGLDRSVFNDRDMYTNRYKYTFSEDQSFMLIFDTNTSVLVLLN